MFKSLPLVAAALLAGSAHAASQPTLDHSAPFLGHTLELIVDGAPASQPLVLFYSPRRGDTPTPFGVLEIERASSQRIATGTTDAQGHATLAIPIPADAALAESEAHFQALIDDPSAPAGKTLSHGVHVRLLGTRVYARVQTDQVPASANMKIVSALTETVVARVQFASNDGYDRVGPDDGKPVFSADHATGAVMESARDLVLFDPFFGNVLGRIMMRPGSRTLFTNTVRERVFVLEQGYFSAQSTPVPGRITAVDLHSGAIVAQLVLPNVTAGMWCANDRRTEAYVAEYVGTQRLPAVRRIDLGTLADLGSISVGEQHAGEAFDTLGFSDRKVIVTTAGGSSGALTRIDLSPAVPTVTTQSDSDHHFELVLAVPVADRILLAREDYPLLHPPSVQYFAAALSQATPLAEVRMPQVTYVPVRPVELELDGSGVWIPACSGPYDDCVGVLFRFDFANATWEQYPELWDVAPRDVTVAQDAYVDCVYAALPNYGEWEGPPEILVIDRAANESRHILLDRRPYIVHAVPVP